MASFEHSVGDIDPASNGSRQEALECDITLIPGLLNIRADSERKNYSRHSQAKVCHSHFQEPEITRQQQCSAYATKTQHKVQPTRVHVERRSTITLL